MNLFVVGLFLFACFVFVWLTDLLVLVTYFVSCWLLVCFNCFVVFYCLCFDAFVIFWFYSCMLEVCLFCMNDLLWYRHLLSGLVVIYTGWKMLGFGLGCMVWCLSWFVLLWLFCWWFNSVYYSSLVVCRLLLV